MTRPPGVLLDMSRIFALTLAFGCGSLAVGALHGLKPPPPVDGSHFRELAGEVRPAAGESEWEEIAWRNGFLAAVEEARTLNRPVLLWAMNGNPCGET